MNMVKCAYAVLDFTDIGEKGFNISISDNSVNKTGLGFKGLCDSYLYCLSYRDIAIAVTEICDNRLKINNECIFEYEKIIENLMKDSSLLPFRFGTAFKDDIEIVRLLKEQYDKFYLNLQKVKNKLEYGLKVMWDYEEAGQKLIPFSYLKENKRTFDILEGSSLYRKYLVNRFKKYKHEEALIKSAENIINDIYFSLEEVSSFSTFKKMLTKKIILDANFLVEKEKEDKFINRFKEIKQRRKDLKFLFTGPWPPYSFTDNYIPTREGLINGLQ
ncbi:MAG: GvpL/GvpF family gas vesicle protein [Candidatus Firestonebacteria bacterium]|nr:GvpL/GvpF family gas vesicle protein [Candidatus Firestonebacteria bacterium]